jgi:plastocyanin
MTDNLLTASRPTKATTANRWWTAGCTVVVVLLAVTACAPSTGGGAQNIGATAADTGVPSSGTQEAAGSTGKRKAGVDVNCTKATKTKIVETSGPEATYAFSPRKLTIKRGAFLAITNTSDRVHALVTTPDAEIVSSVLDLKERQVIQFPEAGTFTVASANAAHRAVLQVRVVGESGCGPTKPTLTIVNGYSFTPAKLSLAATENFAVVNESRAPQSVACTPDPGGNGDNSRLERGETQLLAIDKPGRYVCASLQHPRAKAVLNVKAK